MHCRRGPTANQCAPPTLSTTTPAITSPTPTTLVTLSGSPRNTAPIATMAAVPSPDHIAYATPTGTTFTDCAMNTNASAYAASTPTVGQSFVNPSVALSRLVPTTST